MRDPVRFARNFCTFVGWYGIVTLLPLLFIEAKFGYHQGPPVNHPEFYYGFLCLGLSWQVAFLLLGREPLPHRGFFIPAGLEKLTFGFSIIALYILAKVPLPVAIFGGIDLIFALGFFFIYWRLSILTM